MGKVSRIKFKECRNSAGDNEGYVASLDGKEIAYIKGSSQKGFVTQVIGYNEEFQTKRRLDAEIKLAEKFGIPIRSGNQDELERLSRAFEDMKE